MNKGLFAINFSQTKSNHACYRTSADFSVNPLGGAATMVTTWDFEKNTISFVASGALTGSGSKFTSADLSDSIGTITRFEVRSPVTSWMTLDRMTIETTTIP